MACGCGCSGCGGCINFDEPQDGSGQTGCACAGPFTQVSTLNLGATVVSKLNPIANCLRDLKTKLGARNYEVRLVHTQWVGEDNGQGEEVVISDVPLLPTPKVTDLNALDIQVLVAGAHELGVLQVTEINPMLGEDFLRGWQNGQPPPPGVNFYWEVQFFRGLGQGSDRRRFVLSAVPTQDTTAFQWRATITRAQGDRTRAGFPR